MLITTPLKLLKFVGVRTTILPQPVDIVGLKYKIILRPINHSEKVAGNQNRQYQSTTGDDTSPSVINGLQQLNDPRLNKGLGFTIEERQAMGVHGLMPPQFRSQEQQLEVCLLGVEEQPTDILKYSFLYDLKDRHEKVFFRLLSENIQKYMPIIYTPTVGVACQKFGFIFRKPCGLFITIYDKGHVYDVVKNWPEQDVRVIVVTDGERILGLGDLGANGMGISVGKLCLYTALGGIKPHQCLPVAIDVGTNNKDLRRHPYYVGLRQKRVQEKEYDELIDEFMAAAVKRFGQDILIQFEDFANVNAFKFLKKYQNKYCTFNDDIQGTASVAVAGIFGTQRITKLQISDYKILFYGAGAAATGIAELLVYSMGLLGIPRPSAVKKIWMMDIDGLLVKNRPTPISANTQEFAQDHEPMTDLLAIIKEVKPNVLIGASTVGGAFTPDVITEMGTLNDRPVIFALSNPTEKSECTAENAYKLTKGRAIFASGSPFDPVDVDGKLLRPGQGNNAYIFPGIGLGVLMSGMHHIPNEIFLIAAQTLANFLSEKDLQEGSLFPPLSKVKELSVLIAVNIMNYAYEKEIATTYPEPQDKIEYIRSQQYSYLYENQLPSKYKWPYDSQAITVKNN